VKQLQTDSTGAQTTFISTNAAAPHHRRFDQWPSHGWNLQGYGESLGQSNAAYFSFITQLANGTEYFYFSAKSFDSDFIQNTLANAFYFQVVGYPGNWKGEGFNYIWKKYLTQKIPYSDYYNWYSTH
jgi:hypothetical protein